ncbi:hypothetical protein C0992_002142 [Termitomyces sp. T32_za158]|nr:hypothetical protein C0992_002142 [Termitomyces sp. T32_za158]
MPLEVHRDASYGLAPMTTSHVLDSPGSAIFDLPTQGTSNVPGQKIAQLAHRETRTPKLEMGQPHEVPTSPASFVVVSGGTGGNAICAAFSNACYVLPVSDDGGSSSEIIRVLGGPSIGQLHPLPF